MNRDTVRQIVNVLVTLAVIVVNTLANTIPLNGKNTGEISDSFAVLFTPAGYVFSIWGVIYLGLLAFTIFQALPVQKANPALRRVGYWYALSGVANAAWIFLWHWGRFFWTQIAMLVILGSLLMIYLRLGVGRRRVSAMENWTVQIPFSIYLGWISVATIANTSVLLYTLGWNGFGLSAAAWTTIMLFAGGLIGSLLAFARRDLAYCLVLVWAFAGILAKRMGDYPSIAIVAGAIGAWILFVALFNRLRPAIRAAA